MEYQINSNRVSNGQTPFVTVGFGLGTDWFAREIQRAIFSTASAASVPSITPPSSRSSSSPSSTV